MSIAKKKTFFIAHQVYCILICLSQALRCNILSVKSLKMTHLRLQPMVCVLSLLFAFACFTHGVRKYLNDIRAGHIVVSKGGFYPEVQQQDKGLVTETAQWDNWTHSRV